MKNLRVIGAGLFVLACGVVGVGGYVATGTGTTATGSTPAWVAKYMATGQRDFRDGRGRFGRAGPLSSYTPSFELDREYLWPSATPAYPDPVNDPVFGATARRPIAVCYVGAVDGSITEWQCKGRDGLAFGTMFNATGLGTTKSLFFMPGRAMWISHAAVGDSPELRSTTLDALISSGTFTVLAMIHPRFNADNYYWVLKRAGGTSGNFNIYSTGATFGCSHTIQETTQVGFPIGAWAMVGCSMSGGNDNIVTYQYDDTTEVIAPEVAIAGTGNYIFGNRSSVDSPYGDLGMDGMMGWFAFYDVTLTAAEKQSVHDASKGAYNEAGALAVGSPLAVGVDNTATTGLVDMIDGTNNLVGPGGLIVSKGFTNVWAADALAAATWTDVGTPTVTSNVTSGPFGTWKKAAECDLIEDNDGAAFEGKASGTAGTTEGYVNASCFLKAGTSGTTTTKARIAITVAGGTGSTTCDFTGLSSTVSRKQCTALAGDTPTSIIASILVGGVDTETGSIQTCHCQLTAGGPELQTPMPTNTVVSRISYEVDSTGWGTAANGAKYEIVHTPKRDPDTQWIDAARGTYYLFDPTTNGVQHAGTLIYGYQNPGIMYSQGLVTDIGALTVEQPYAWSLEWRPVGGGNGNFVVRHDSCGATPGPSCVATTSVDTSNGDALPGQPNGTTCIGLRCDGSAYGADATVSALRTYVLR